MEYNGLSYYPGGLTYYTIAGLTKDTVTAFNWVEFRKLILRMDHITPQRFDELYQRCNKPGGKVDIQAFVLMIYHETILMSEISFTRIPTHASWSWLIKLNDFGVPLGLSNGYAGLGLHRVRDSFYRNKSEIDIMDDMIRKYNQNAASCGRPGYEPDEVYKKYYDEDNVQFVTGEKFKLRKYLTVEKTKFGSPCGIDWETSTTSTILFIHRKKEIFAATTGLGFEVIVPKYFDREFPKTIANWIRGQPLHLLKKTALFYKRNKAEDLITACSIMSEILKSGPVTLTHISDEKVIA